jgi:hypothetical protein
MEAKKILDDSLKQDGFFSQESVMPQYHSCIKAVQKALTTSLTDTEEGIYGKEEVKNMLFDISSTLINDDKDEDELIKTV